MPQQRKTECKRGHDLTDPANVKTKANGERQCRICLRAAQKAYAVNAKGKRPCAVTGCTNGNSAGGKYCASHGNRRTRLGDMYEDVPISGHYGGYSLEKVRTLQNEGSPWPQTVRNQGG